MADNVGDIGRHRDLLSQKSDEGTPAGARRSFHRSQHPLFPTRPRSGRHPKVRRGDEAAEVSQHHQAFIGAGLSLGGLRRSFAVSTSWNTFKIPAGTTPVV